MLLAIAQFSNLPRLNNTGPSTEPCGTLLVTSLQDEDEDEPLMSTLWVVSASQLQIHLIVTYPAWNA